MPRLFVENLTVIDCSILDPDRGLIGASWIVNIELFGKLDEQSMVFDFAKVKKTIKHIIDLEVDHKLLVPTLYPGSNISNGEQPMIEFTDRQQQLVIHESPASAVCLLATSRVSQSSVMDFLHQVLIQALPDNIHELRIELSEESNAGNYYCYSHGLKKHDGNCQRIAHGHRSQIQVFNNGVRDDRLEKSVATQWHDIYLGTIEDVTSQKNGRVRFAYAADQGNFMLELPKERVYLMHNDSTVECIAEHIYTQLIAEPSGSKIKVKAFEGVGKGAIAHAPAEL